ncbi:MAG: arsenic efflux protein [Lachnospiraceae bacterium]|nr:arsenic efflux protein [Lachnospiraceae bacterium]
MLHVIEHSVIDSIKLVPFLFLTYLAMEYLEHRTGNGIQKWLKNADKAAPVIGGLLGAVPQCGFSAAASNLYAGRVITLGTLIAIYLSTSDEMLPVLISERAPFHEIMGILLGKALIGMTAGLLIDLIRRRKGTEPGGSIHDICEQEHCHCEKGIFLSAVTHTVQIAFFILLVTVALNLVLHFAGEDILEKLLRDKTVLGPVLAGAVGLIPNCAGSVVITQLYLEGALSLGAAMAGLLTGSGVGVLVLFRVNHNRKENLKILGLLYGIGVAAGILTGFFSA